MAAREETIEVIIGTKAGFLPYINSFPSVSDKDFFYENYVDTEIIKEKWIVGDWQCFHPDYLDWQLNQSLESLNQSKVDIFYLHNPEAMTPFLSELEFFEIIKIAFVWCGEKVKEGKIGCFGISSWGGMLGLSKDENFNLAECYQIAIDVGVADYFKVIQAPFSAGLTQALTHKTQRTHAGQPISLLRLAKENGMHFFGSAPFLHGELLQLECPKELLKCFPWNEDNQVYLDFSRSCPGISTAIMGTMSKAHLQQAIDVMNKERSEKGFKDFFNL